MQEAEEEGEGGRKTYLTPIGYQSGSCGYCKGEASSRTPDSRASYYLTSTSLCPRHYQILMDRGWRRSGTLLYLPDASRSCCPHYTIKLRAPDLKPTRDQRQALNRWNRFVLGERYIKEKTTKYPLSKEEKKRQNTTFNLIEAIHESEASNLKPDLHPDHQYTVTLEPSTFTEEKFQLFDHYQRHVHHETDSDISRPGFKRFLCSSPLHRSAQTSTTPQYGSFHQCHRLDGRLIAMSILDLLPSGVSSVYFLYHADYAAWSFGKLSALREAALAIEGGHEWVYMGYYIHSCKKMQYKGDYKTQLVLDFDSLGWDPLDDKMRDLMEKRKWVSRSRERAIEAALADTTTSSDRTSLEQTLVEKAYTVPLASPIQASRANLPIFSLRIPSVMTAAEVRGHIDLTDVKITFGFGAEMRMGSLRSFAAEDGSGGLGDPGTAKGLAAEFAAVVGPVVAREAFLDFSRGGSGGGEEEEEDDDE